MSSHLVCYECWAVLRENGKDVAEIHTSSSGEDVCSDCCDICNKEADGEFSNSMEATDGQQT